MITTAVQTMLETATAKALATGTSNDINVVPVSMIKVQSDSVWLFNFFMNKTAENIRNNPHVALSAWSDMKGIQLKGTVVYLTEGEDFDSAVTWVKTQNPNRIVKGLIVLTPMSVFDISPGGAFSPEELAL